MLVRVLLAHTIVMTLAAFSTNVFHVIVLRLLQGIMGGTSTVVMAIIAFSVDEEHLTEAIGYQQSIQTAGQLLGPAVGGIVASILGFRVCFLMAGILVAMAIPFALWARFEDAQKRAANPEKIHLSDFREIGRDLFAIFVIMAAYNFIVPILPIYLTEAGVSNTLLASYTGAILAAGGLAYALSVPITTRLFGRKALPFLLTIASAAVFLQGFFRQVLGFVLLRIAQCVLHSPGPSYLFSGTKSKDPRKGLKIGILSSARYLGSAVGPFLSSSVTYATNLTTAFTVTAALSLLAAFATIPPKDGNRFQIWRSRKT